MEKIQKIIEFTLNKGFLPVSEISKEIGTDNKYILEYIEIIDFICKIDVRVEINRQRKFTFIKIDST